MSGPEDQRQKEVEAEQTALAVAGEITEADRQQPTGLQRLQRLLHKYPWLAPLVFLSVMLVIFSFGNERFLTPFNASLIVQQVMFVGTLAIGQTIIILTAGIDLSVGAIAVFVSVIMGKLSADFGVPGVAALGSRLPLRNRRRPAQRPAHHAPPAATVHRHAGHAQHLLRAEPLRLRLDDHRWPGHGYRS